MNSRSAQILAFIPQQGVLPLYFNESEAISLQVLETLYSAGIRAVEYTNRGQAALQNFKAMRQLANGLPDLYLGIGTIRNAEAAKAFIDAGADFLISPFFDADVADVAYLHKILWLPGCMTPTEIHEADKAGCKLIKLFPGNVLGPGFMGAIKEVFPHLQFMPTGGVELEEANLKAWFASGVVAVGMGSKLVTKQIMQQGQYELLKQNTEKALSLIAQIKG
ncbi:MAG TPA: bifunctional 4-hydroxy-2-oxoglutarate aldolase/2-dehydro-3-deoxy-phosphogluconate aldolase [Phnomibacter sp.]|nr:bifunctional 4-hydroxy-2-oxoglutarate aldolase/2-dehydro-3-deoxy-phosphogluconate aldolase [Phnomibacter sp.]